MLILHRSPPPPAAPEILQRGTRSPPVSVNTLSLSSLRAIPTTIIPLSTNALHVAAPMPDDAPVTTATFPSHLSIMSPMGRVRLSKMSASTTRPGCNTTHPPGSIVIYAHGAAVGRRDSRTVRVDVNWFIRFSFQQRNRK